MTPRFTMVAGPNGSGKTTLMRRLAGDYAVNFYSILNADDIFAEVSRTGRYLPHIPVTDDLLRSYAAATTYSDDVKAPFRDGRIVVESDCVRFIDPKAVNSYTVALLVEAVQEIGICQHASFSQETVFSHPSKVDALRKARKEGFRTYLYFVATGSPLVNVARVENRARLGGHAVPPEKIASRFPLSVANAAAALPYLSRAYFFDNSSETMRFFAEWDADAGLLPADGERAPDWFAPIADAAGKVSVPGGGSDLRTNAAIAASAAAASRGAVESAFEAGLPITVMRGGRIVRVSPDGTERSET